MRTEGPDLEPVLDDAASAVRVENAPADAQRPRRALANAGTALALALTAAFVVASVASHRELQATRADRDRLERLAIRQSDAKARVEATIRRMDEAQTAKEERRGKAVASELAELANELVMRDPIVVLPPAPAACRPRDLEFAGAQTLEFLRFFNRSGRGCALVDYPAVQGRDQRGVWRTIPVLPSLGSSYTDGPPWTGTFNPHYTAVLSLRAHPLGPELDYCFTGAGTAGTFSDLRLVLVGQVEPIDIGTPFELGACRPTLLLWAYDSTDS